MDLEFQSYRSQKEGAPRKNEKSVFVILCKSSLEITTHYLFDCRLFHIQRDNFFNKVNTILVKHKFGDMIHHHLQLYGHHFIVVNDKMLVHHVTIKDYSLFLFLCTIV